MRRPRPPRCCRAIGRKKKRKEKKKKGPLEIREIMESESF
jgi:hypothetical protein